MSWAGVWVRILVRSIGNTSWVTPDAAARPVPGRHAPGKCPGLFWLNRWA